MGCNCGGKRSTTGAALESAQQSGLWSGHWNAVLSGSNRSALHPTGVEPRHVYDAAAVADARQIEGLAAPVDFPTVVEFGAGDGRLAGPLSERYATVHAVERAPAAQRHLRVNAPKAARVADDGRGLWDHLGGPVVDLVVVHGVLEFMPVRHGQQLVKILAAVLRPGGRMLATVRLGAVDQDPAETFGRSTWSARTLDTAAADAGLSVVEEVESSRPGAPLFVLESPGGPT